MAVTLTRAGVTPTDDDLTGNFGTAIDAAWADALMDAIDALFAGAFSLVGPLTVTGFGTHSFSAGGTGGQDLLVRNTTAGAGNYTTLSVGNNSSATRSQLVTYSSTFTPSGSAFADGTLLYAEGAGGLTLQAAHASGVIRFYSGGTTERMALSAAGLLTVNGVGTHSFSGASANGNVVKVANTTNGAVSYSSFRLETGSTIGEINTHSQSYTTGSWDVQASLAIRSTGVGGISIASTSASGMVRFYAAGTEVGRWDLTSSLQLGGTAARSGTAGTKRIDVFDGTAPTGTLANGCSIYSTAGELYTMDAAGNATLQTPHDHGTDWVFKSENKVTGKYVRIETEKLLKRLNARFGEPEWVVESHG